MNATPAYDFLDRPARPAKPRTRGLTVVSDKAKSLAQAKDIEDAYIIEGMRHGLHRASDYDYFHAYCGKALPQVPAIG